MNDAVENVAPEDDLSELEAAERQVRDHGETPLCEKCLSPIDPLKHYCENCGWASGNLTPYIPFVNIRYNYSIFGNLWKKVWLDPEPTLTARFFSFFLIILITPVMILGLPFLLSKHPPGDEEN